MIGSKGISFWFKKLKTAEAFAYARMEDTEQNMRPAPKLYRFHSGLLGVCDRNVPVRYLAIDGKMRTVYDYRATGGQCAHCFNPWTYHNAPAISRFQIEHNKEAENLPFKRYF